MAKERDFLLCDDDAAALALDQQVLAHFVQTVNAQAVGWSGIMTDGVDFGIRWKDVLIPILGDPEIDPNLKIKKEKKDESGVGDWKPYKPPAPPEEQP